MPTWRGTTDSNWGTASNWLTDGSGSGVPDATKNATFDASSPACTVNGSTRTCLALNFTGYANSITFTNTVNASGSVTLSNTAIYNGPNGIGMVGATSTITFNSATYNLPLTITRTYNTGASTFTFADSGQVSNFVVSSGGGTTSITLSGISSVLSVSGNLTGGGMSTSSNISLVLNGSGNLSGTFTTNLTFNSPGGTINVTGALGYYSMGGVGITKTLLYLDGTINWNGFTILFYASSSSTLNINFPYPIFATQFTNQVNNGAVYTLLSDLTVTNLSSTILPGSSGGNTVVLNGFNINVTGNFTATAFVRGTTKIWIIGTGTINAGTGNSLEINSPSGTVTIQALTFSATSAALTFTYTTAFSLVHTGATSFSDGNITVNNLGGANFAAMAFVTNQNNPTLTLTLNHNISCTGLTLWSTGGPGIVINGNNIYLSGNLSRTSTPTVTGTTTLNFTGGSGTAIWAAGLNYGINFTINKNVSITESLSFITTGRLINVTNGLVNPNSTTITTANNINLTINGMTFWNLTIPGTSTITQNTLNTIQNNLTLCSVGNVTFNGTAGWTCANLLCSTANRTITLQAGITYTTTTSVTMLGTNAQKILMTSSAPTTTYAIWKLQNPASQSMAYVSATAIDSSLGMTIYSFSGIISTAAPVPTLNWALGAYQGTKAFTFVS